MGVIKYPANTWISTHFNSNEFRCPHCGIMKISKELVDKLEVLFAKVHASKCIISSGYRCAYYDKKENGAEFRHLYTSFSRLKYGFIPIIFGNSYYFGYYFLAMIFRPISSEFVPYELKNNHYVKAKRRLWNFMNSKSLKAKRRKFSAKLKQSMN